MTVVRAHVVKGSVPKKKLTKKERVAIHKAFEHLVSVKDGYHGGNPSSELAELRSDVNTILEDVGFLPTGDDEQYVSEICTSTLKRMDGLIARRASVPAFGAKRFDDSPDSVMLHEMLATDFIDSIDSELVYGVDGMLHHGII